MWGAKLCKWTVPALYVFLCCCCIAVCRLSSDTQDGPALRKQFKHIHQPHRKKLDDDKFAKLASSGFWKDKSRRERDREKTAFCLVFLLVCSEGHSINTDATITTTTTHSVTLFECLNFFIIKTKKSRKKTENTNFKYALMTRRNALISMTSSILLIPDSIWCTDFAKTLSQALPSGKKKSPKIFIYLFS